MAAKLLIFLHFDDQIKLNTTKISLIKGGIQLPMIQVNNETMLRGKIQYPSKLALWKNDLNDIIKIHVRSKKICIKPNYQRTYPHDNKDWSNDGLLRLWSPEG